MRIRMISYSIDDIRPDAILSEDLFLDEQFLLVSRSCPVSADTIKAVRAWGFKKVMLDRAEEAETLAPDLSGGNNPSGSPQTEHLDDDHFAEKSSTLAEETLKIKELVSDAHSHRDDKEMSNTDRISMVQKVYDEFLVYIEKVYTRFATHTELNLLEMSRTSKLLCQFIQDYRRYVLRINPSQPVGNKNFIIHHSMRSTVLAISIGLQLHMPEDKLVELSVACMIHEIGMIRLPPYLYLTDRALTHSEKNHLFTHPILGYNILKDENFPLSIQLAALEHHERENGSGYPQHLKGDKIPLYAKIIAVTCSFEAITSPRTFKESRTSFEAMTEMLKNENLQYDGTVLKALLFSLSLFPIGAYVYLSNGKTAQVTDVSPISPKNPIVTIIGEKDAEGKPITVQTNDTNMKIVRVMNKEESSELIKEGFVTPE